MCWFVWKKLQAYSDIVYMMLHLISSTYEKIRKILEKMRSNPRDWRIKQLKSLAVAHGVEYRQPGTSHVTFRHSNGAKSAIPAHRPIAPEYVKQFHRLITQCIID